MCNIKVSHFNHFEVYSLAVSTFSCYKHCYHPFLELSHLFQLKLCIYYIQIPHPSLLPAPGNHQLPSISCEFDSSKSLV